MFAGLDQKTLRMVAAGSMHCVCLTGVIHKRCCVLVVFNHLDLNVHFHFGLEVATVPVQHIPHIPMFLLSPEDGDLFVWGSNKHGQLISRELFLSSATPVKRSLLGGENVRHVWSGWTHIVAQTGEACLITADFTVALLNPEVFGAGAQNEVKWQIGR